MRPHRIKIVLTPNVSGSTVHVDGVEVRNVRSIQVDATIDDASIVRLELIANEVTVEGTAGGVRIVQPARSGGGRVTALEVAGSLERVTARRRGFLEAVRRGYERADAWRRT